MTNCNHGPKRQRTRDTQHSDVQIADKQLFACTDFAQMAQNYEYDHLLTATVAQIAEYNNVIFT